MEVELTFPERAPVPTMMAGRLEAFRIEIASWMASG
jgi:hypothetical protein